MYVNYSIIKLTLLALERGKTTTPIAPVVYWLPLNASIIVLVLVFESHRGEIHTFAKPQKGSTAESA